ncbi:hypothetical protein H4S06_002871 [Coemansia sp. BCRC 34490]|nr:hypothetical protein H4S06_002871 [Coemansia sp. BCRC 34490]
MSMRQQEEAQSPAQELVEVEAEAEEVSRYENPRRPALEEAEAMQLHILELRVLALEEEEEVVVVEPHCGHLQPLEPEVAVVEAAAAAAVVVIQPRNLAPRLLELELGLEEKEEVVAAAAVVQHLHMPVPQL